MFLVDTGDAMSPELSRETRTRLCALTSMLSSYQVRPAQLSTPGISATWPSERQDPLIPEASGSAVLAGLGGPQSAKAGTW